MLAVDNGEDCTGVHRVWLYPLASQAALNLKRWVFLKMQVP